MSHSLQTIEIDRLASITGGQAQAQQQQQPGDEEAPPPGRSWGQMGREYAAACVSGVGQSFVYGGRPRNLKQGLVQAGIGCATGMGMKAIEDVSGMISGTPY